MKLLRITQTIVALAGLTVAASAQQPNGTTQGGATGVAPKGKIAVINTGVFMDQIGEFRAKVEALNRQFEPRLKEVQSKGERIAALENTIKTQSGILTPARIAEMTEQLEREKIDYKRKTEDLEVDGNKARDQMLEPVREKLTKFVEAYMARKSISILLDLGNALESKTLLWYDPRLDITKEFVEEYNRMNPVPAAAAPAPQKP